MASKSQPAPHHPNVPLVHVEHSSHDDGELYSPAPRESAQANQHQHPSQRSPYQQVQRLDATSSEPIAQTGIPLTLEEYVTRYNQEVEAEDYKAGCCCCRIDTYPRMAYYLAMVFPMCVFPWLIVFQPRGDSQMGSVNHEARDFHQKAFIPVLACVAAITVGLTVVCCVYVVPRPRAQGCAVVGMGVWIVAALGLHASAYGLSHCIAHRDLTSDTSYFNCLPLWFLVGPLFPYPFIALPIILIFLCIYSSNKKALNTRQLRVAGGPCHQPGEGDWCSTYHQNRRPVSSFADIASSVNAGQSSAVGTSMRTIA